MGSLRPLNLPATVSPRAGAASRIALILMAAAFAADPSGAQAPGDAEASGVRSAGLSLSIGLRAAPVARDLSLEVRLSNRTGKPTTVSAGRAGDLRVAAVIYDPSGSAVSPPDMITLWGPVLALHGLPQEQRTLEVPAGTSAALPDLILLGSLCRDLPAGRYTAMVVGFDSTKGITSLLVSNLVTFDWPGPAKQ